LAESIRAPARPGETSRCPIERRTCKHLRTLRGEAAEQPRIGQLLPAPVASEAKAKAPKLLLAEAWEDGRDLAGWWMSEKLDGVRAYWNRRRFLSQQGTV
jgi:DNA ligase-1